MKAEGELKLDKWVWEEERRPATTEMFWVE